MKIRYDKAFEVIFSGNGYLDSDTHIYDSDISILNLRYERILRDGSPPRIGKGPLLIKPGEVCSRIMDKIV